MIEVINSPWENTFLNLLKGAKSEVYLASPFIKQQTAQLITENTNHNIDLRYINSFKLSNFHRGASDLEALRILKKNSFRQKNVHNLHAKFFIFDNVAVITSGNLTPGGLRNNLEYGVLLRDETVDKIKNDYVRIFDNHEYPEINLDVIKKAADILRAVPREKQTKIKVTEKVLFEEILNDENIEERFDGGTESIKANLTSWKKDVFECLLVLNNDVFTLEEVYSFERGLKQLHPKNRNVKAKIRQQLQYLRDIGLIEFTRPGQYKKLWVA
jgi:phosphatidylserine/phosphatidylglycerophosphate/cardiolipin synthase-like enzyme